MPGVSRPPEEVDAALDAVVDLLVEVTLQDKESETRRMEDVYTDLERISRRFEKLTALFKAFHADGTPLLESPGLRGIKIGELADGTAFDLTLAGLTVRFVLSLPAPRTLQGRISCYRLDPFTRTVATPAAGHFDFNGDGLVAGKKMPGTGDPLRVGTDSDAAFLIAELVRDALIPSGDA